MRKALAWGLACGGAGALASAAPFVPRSVSEWRQEGISSSDFESHPAFDARNRALYFVRSRPSFQGWRIQYTECRGGGWSEPRPAPFSGEGAEADPFLTPDGRTLYFISNRKDDGATGRALDLWRVDRATPTAPWGRPVRLPEPINSPGREWFPRLAPDGSLYFGSDRPGGLGATDIYRARLVRGAWRVENLGPGVNGPGDEYEAEISRDGKRMVLMADGDLFLVARKNGRWGGRTKLGPQINSPELEVGPLLSPDGKSLLFARDLGERRGAGELMLAGAGKAGRWPPSCPK